MAWHGFVLFHLKISFYFSAPRWRVLAALLLPLFWMQSLWPRNDEAIGLCAKEKQECCPDMAVGECFMVVSCVPSAPHMMSSPRVSGSHCWPQPVLSAVDRTGPRSVCYLS